MTTTDKTGEKLAASVRRTKENVAQEAAPEAPVKKAPVKRATATATTKPAATKTPPSKRTTAARKSATSTVAKTPLDDVDLYQGGRRIWPD